MLTTQKMADQNMIVIKSQNVRGLSNSMKRKRLFSWLQQTKADVLFLQETHSTPDSEHEWKKDWGGGGGVSYSHMEAVQAGVHVYYSLGSLMK